MPLANQLRAEVADGIQAVKVRQLLVVDREVDVETTFGCRGNAFVETGVHVDDRVDAELRDRRPLADRRRDVELAVVIDAVEVDCGKHEEILKESGRPGRSRRASRPTTDCGRARRAAAAGETPALRKANR